MNNQKIQMSQIGKSETKTSQNKYRDPLSIEAQKNLKKQGQNKTQSSKLTLFISFCAYHIDDPNKIISLVKNSLKERKQLSLFLKALYSVSLRYISHTSQRSAIEKIYHQFLQIDFVRKALLQSCDIPTQIRPNLKIEKKPKKVQKLSQQSEIFETLDNANSQVLNNNIRKGIVKLMLLFSSINHSFTQNDYESIWKKIVAIIGEFEISPFQLLGFFVQNLIPLKKYEFTTFCFKKITTYISSSTIINFLTLNQSTKFKFSHKHSNESSLFQALQEYSINGLPLDSNITACVLLVKANILSLKQVFLKLQPLSFKDLYNMSKQDQKDNNTTSTQHNNKDRKQQFLTQLILMNAVDLFKNLVTQFKIKVPFLEYPPLYYAMSELLEWLIDPLFKVITFAHCFPKSCKRKFQSKVFPAGSHNQLTVINKSLYSVFFLAEISEGNIFARRSTYLKFCKLFKAFFDNHKNLKIIQQEKDGICGMICICLYKYIIPTLQFYNQDSSILTALNSLLECFPTHYYQIIMLNSLQCKQIQPYQLLKNTLQTSQQIKGLLNKISNSNSHIIQVKIKKLVYSRPFSSLIYLFNRLFLDIKDTMMMPIIKLVCNSYILIKKIFILYIMNYLLQRENELVSNNGSFTPSFTTLISLIKNYLVQQRQNKILINFLIEYLISKLKPNHKPEEEMTKYEFFNSEIPFFFNILQFVLPIETDESSIDIHQNIYNSINGAGICLKVNFLQTIDNFVKGRPVRQNLSKSLLNSANPLQTNFYKILVMSYQLYQKVFAQYEYTMRHLVYFTDHINRLINFLTQFIHLEVTKSQLIQTYFSFNLFDQLLNKYKIPLQICFTLLRRSIFYRYSFNQETSFFYKQDWHKIKQDYNIAVDKYLKQGIYNEQVELKNLSANSFSKVEMQKCMKNELYLLFWVLPYQISENRNEQYVNALQKIEGEMKQVDSQQQYKYKQAFLIDLKAEYHQTLKFKQISLILKSPSIKKFSFFNSNNEQSLDLLMFIKKCVISRALLSKSDAYFSWSFLLYLIRQNRKGPQFLFHAIYTLRVQIAKKIILQTPRQASVLLPFLANLPNYLTQNCYERQQLSQRLRNIQMLKGQLSKQLHKKIMKIVKQSSNQIINHLLSNYSKMQQFTLSNIIDFIIDCKFIPMCQHQISIINNFLEETKQNNNYGIDTKKLQRATTEITKRQKIIESKTRSLSRASKDNASDNSQTHEKKFVHKKNKNKNKKFKKYKQKSDSPISTQETKSTTNLKTITNPDMKGVTKQENLMKMNLLSEHKTEKNQRTEKITKNEKLQRSSKSIHNNSTFQHKFEQSRTVETIQISDDDQ